MGEACIRIEERIALTQPDLPEPVVPATSTCGIFARSVQTGVAVDPLAQPGDERRGLLGATGVDVAEADDAAARVRNLDADCLLAGNRRQDADVGGGERVGEVVGELGHLLHLGAGREAQFVARDVRAADDADDLRLDAEVPERLDQLAADDFVIARIDALVGLAPSPALWREAAGSRSPRRSSPRACCPAASARSARPIGSTSGAAASSSASIAASSSSKSWVTGSSTASSGSSTSATVGSTSSSSG